MPCKHDLSLLVKCSACAREYEEQKNSGIVQCPDCDAQLQILIKDGKVAGVVFLKHKS